MMGGSGSSYTNWKSDQLADAVRKDTEESGAEYQAALAGYFSELLGAFNGRDVDLVHQRLDRIKEFLQEELESAFDQIFGGSVAKHTYVDGLSDIDSLLVINGSTFEGQNPVEVLEQITAVLREKIGNEATIDHGAMAVTASYADNMTIQLLPALRSESGLRIPAARRNVWSEIDPDAFRGALVKSNAECGGKLVPTIKLAKAVIGNLPERYQLAGYHVESLAVAAFEEYKGEKTTAAMLPYFFDRAKDLVLKAIRDPSGQSTHVDEYLGPDDSTVRQEVGHLLGGITKRMRTASASQSKGQWEALFYDE
jgi:Second Messenger Oligonucleotide or Dinucleotide Synthetase domain